MPSNSERPAGSAVADDAAAAVPRSSVTPPPVTPVTPPPVTSAPVTPAPVTPKTAPRRPSPTPAEPPLSQLGKRSISGAAWAALVTGVIVLIFMLVFILQNNVPTQFTFLAWTFNIPLGVAVLFAAIAGALITAMVGTVRMVVLGRNVRKLKHQRAAA